MSFEPLLSGRKLEAFRAIRDVIAPLWDVTSPTWNAPDTTERATYSLSRDNSGEYTVALHIDQRDGQMHRQIANLLERYPDSIIHEIGGGEAQSAYPDQGAFQPHAISREFRPGVSVSHGRYRSGTLGAIVQVKSDGATKKCAVSAGHVLALNRTVERGDWIYSPGKQTIPRLTRREIIGNLTDDIIDLYPITDVGEATAAEDVALDVDICLIELDRRGLERLPLQSIVPDPSGWEPDKPLSEIKSLHIKECMPENLIKEKILTEVFLFGGVSGFRRGILTNALVQFRVIKLPNNRNYLYKDLLAIKSIDGMPFSRGGDSGSMIYTKNGLLLGFLIGADAYASFACIADRALQQLRAEIV